MHKLNTVYELMEVIEKYHVERCSNYQIALKHNPETMTKLVIEKLLELEKRSLSIITKEKSKMDPKKSSYMSSGPTLTIAPEEASDCGCKLNPSFQEALDCVFKSDKSMDDMLDRLEHSTSNSSIKELATMLKEIHETKSRQISNYTRMD